MGLGKYKEGHVIGNIFVKVQEAGVIINSSANGRIITCKVPIVIDLC